MPAITLRAAVASDVEAIAAVHIASWRSSYRGLMPDALLDGLSVDERAERWRERLATQRVLVAEREGRLVGFCASLRQAGAPPFIGALYLDPAELRRGIGTRLLRATVRELVDAGEREVELQVLEGNHRARAFYARHGFVATGERDEWHGGREIRMRLALTSSGI